MSSKAYYQTYQADFELGQLNRKLADVILSYKPISVFEFGCGSGKNLDYIHNSSPFVVTCGLDISFINIVHAYSKFGKKFLVYGDETHLGHFHNFDVAFTCSVLDHIEDIRRPLNDLISIANRATILAETNDKVGQFYYPHDYEKYGFTKIDYSWKSPSDNATYHIWIRERK